MRRRRIPHKAEGRVCALDGTGKSSSAPFDSANRTKRRIKTRAPRHPAIWQVAPRSRATPSPADALAKARRNMISIKKANAIDKAAVFDATSNGSFASSTSTAIVRGGPTAFTRKTHSMGSAPLLPAKKTSPMEPIARSKQPHPSARSKALCERVWPDAAFSPPRSPKQAIRNTRRYAANENARIGRYPFRNATSESME